MDPSAQVCFMLKTTHRFIVSYSLQSAKRCIIITSSTHTFNKLESIHLHQTDFEWDCLYKIYLSISIYNNIQCLLWSATFGSGAGNCKHPYIHGHLDSVCVCVVCVMSNNQAKCQPMDWYNDCNRSYDSSCDGWLRYHVENEVNTERWTVVRTHVCTIPIDLIFYTHNSIGWSHHFQFSFPFYSSHQSHGTWNGLAVFRFIDKWCCCWHALYYALCRRMSWILTQWITFGKKQTVADSWLGIRNSKNNNDNFHSKSRISYRLMSRNYIIGDSLARNANFTLKLLFFFLSKIEVWETGKKLTWDMCFGSWLMITSIRIE